MRPFLKSIPSFKVAGADSVQLSHQREKKHAREGLVESEMGTRLRDVGAPQKQSS